MRTMSPKISLILSIAAAILVLVASFSLWLQRDIFDQDAFVSKSEQVITKKPVREAIADEIVTEAFADVPALETIVGDFLQSNLSALLDSEAIEPAIENIATQIHTALTASDPQAVSIDISSVTQPVKSIIKEVPGLDPQIRRTVRAIPNSVVLVEKGGIPSIYTFGTFFLWVGPIAGLAGLGLLIAVVWLAGSEGRGAALRRAGASLGIASAVFLLLIQAYKAPVLTSFSGNVRIIFENIYDAFAAGLISQTWALFIIGLVAFLAGYGLDYLAGRRGPEKHEEAHKEAA